MKNLWRAIFGSKKTEELPRYRYLFNNAGQRRGSEHLTDYAIRSLISEPNKLAARLTDPAPTASRNWAERQAGQTFERQAYHAHKAGSRTVTYVIGEHDHFFAESEAARYEIDRIGEILAEHGPRLMANILLRAALHARPVVSNFWFKKRPGGPIGHHYVLGHSDLTGAVWGCYHHHLSEPTHKFERLHGCQRCDMMLFENLPLDDANAFFEWKKRWDGAMIIQSTPDQPAGQEPQAVVDWAGRARERQKRWDKATTIQRKPEQPAKREPQAVQKQPDNAPRSSAPVLQTHVQERDRLIANITRGRLVYKLNADELKEIESIEAFYACRAAAAAAGRY